MSKIKIYMVDDHEFVVSITKEYLSLSGMEFIGRSTTYADAAQNALANSPDVIIVDLNLGDGSGIDLIHYLKSKDPEGRTKYLMFSARTLASLPAIAAAYRAGANGYLAKNSEPSELVNAINQIHSGKDYYMPEYAEKILNYLKDGKDPDPRLALTKGEYRIFFELANGLSVEEVAKKLNINQNTVRTRISDIRKNLKNTTEDFSVIANRHGISFLNV